MGLQACTSEPRPLFHGCKQVGVAQIERDQHAVARVSAAVPVRLHLQGKLLSLQGMARGLDNV